LFHLIRSAPDTLRYEHQLILAEGDYVIVHGRFSAWPARRLGRRGRSQDRRWPPRRTLGRLQDEATAAESKAACRCLATASLLELQPRSRVNDLLKLAVEAHGGLTRWNRLAAVEAHLSISGALWHLKGKPTHSRTSASRLPCTGNV